MRVIRLVLVLVLLWGLLVFVQAQPDDEEDLSDVNCAVNPELLLGQAHTGYLGAAHTGYLGANGETIEDAGLVLDAEDLITDLQFGETGSEKVAILIVDDFSGDQPETPDENAEWQTTTHGWLVRQLFDEMHAELPEAVADNITLVNIDLASEDINYRSDLLADELETQINTLHTDESIDSFVVNMSFVFVACDDGSFQFHDFIERHSQDADLTLVEDAGGDLDYVTGALNNPAVERMDTNGFDVDRQRGTPPEFVATQLAFLQLFEQNQLQSDDLRDFFRDGIDEVTIVPVASAGNFKWKRPFYPARWAEVISVSATQGMTADMWSQSNNGELSAPGAWLRLGEDYFTAGTSYAAPVASMMIAIDLTQATPDCGFQANSPELTTNGRYNDDALGDAVTDRCD